MTYQSGAGSFTPSQSDSRKELRTQVQLESVLGSSMLGKRKVELLDISNFGCRALCALSVEVGTKVVLTMPGLAPIGAQIRWSRQGCLGLQFATPLHPLILERLVAGSRGA